MTSSPEASPLRFEEIEEVLAFLREKGHRVSTAGRLVLEANQALLWGILSATGKGWDITGQGRLLRANTSTT